MTTRLRPSLTTEQLHEIGQRRHNPDPGDVLALLWEIKLLHCIARRADQYLLSPNSFVEGVLRKELNELPCVQESQAERRAWDAEQASWPPEGRRPRGGRD